MLVFSWFLICVVEIYVNWSWLICLSLGCVFVRIGIERSIIMVGAMLVFFGVIELIMKFPKVNHLNNDLSYF